MHNHYTTKTHRKRCYVAQYRHDRYVYIPLRGMQPYPCQRGAPFETPARACARERPPSRATYGGQRMTSKTKGEAEKLTRPVSFRLTAADHAAYLAKVEASGLKPSEFFRECVLQNRTQIVARQTVSKDWGRLAYLFNKASNNINQLAHRANADHLAGITTEETYTRILAELHTLAHYMKAALKDAD